MPDRADVVANLGTGASEYTQGQEVVVSCQWSDPSRTTPPVDPATGFTIVSPTTVTAILRAPDGTESRPAVVASGFVYSITFLAAEPGQYAYGFQASGSFVGLRRGDADRRPRSGPSGAACTGGYLLRAEQPSARYSFGSQTARGPQKLRKAREGQRRGLD